MTKSLIITLFMLGSAVSHAQIDDYEIETVEKNIAKENNRDVEENYKASNKAVDSDSSPQINIYNANSNANKQNQKAKVEAEQDQVQDQDQKASLDSYTTSEAGAEYVVRANEIRNNRKNMEVGTEQKMIEKIEWSRIEDEKERADRLFGHRLEEKRNHHEEHENEEREEREEKTVVIVEKPVYAQAPVVHQQVVVEREETNSWWGRETYISPMFGTANYNKADNVRGDMALGVALGSRLDSNIAIEGTFLYSNYEMDDYAHYRNNNPGLKDVAQYNGTLGMKYNFDLGRVSPHIGALLGYTYRSYDEKRNGSGSGDSNAFDAGLSAGVDVKIARNFSIGAEYRYMRNVAYDRSEDKSANQQLLNQQAFNPATAGKNLAPLEEIGYSMFLVSGKLTF